jgi:hypothetical protein
MVKIYENHLVKVVGGFETNHFKFGEIVKFVKALEIDQVFHYYFSNGKSEQRLSENEFRLIS